MNRLKLGAKSKEEPLIIVTGAAGFIGSCIVRFLNDKGLTNLILVDDIKKTEKWKNLYNKKCADFLSKQIEVDDQAVTLQVCTISISGSCRIGISLIRSGILQAKKGFKAWVPLSTEARMV